MNVCQYDDQPVGSDCYSMMSSESCLSQVFNLKTALEFCVKPDGITVYNSDPCSNLVKGVSKCNYFAKLQDIPFPDKNIHSSGEQ